MGRRKSGRKATHCRQTTLKSTTPNLEQGNKVQRTEDIACPIDVYSRLTYPLVRSFVKDNLSRRRKGDRSDEEDEEEEETVRLTFRPRFVFASSLCLICMERSRVFCEGCGMVSYCSPKHRTQGWTKHSDLCAALKEMRGSFPTRNPNERRLTGEEYRVYRLKLLEILQSEIGRALDLWEREIVLYPRVCRVCRDPSAMENLLRCAACGMDYFCKDHESEHAKWCKEFLVFRRCLFMQHRHGSVDPQIPMLRPERALRLPESFDETMLQLYGRSPYYLDMDCHTYTTLSHVCTIPLTALHSMQISCPEWQSRTEWTIHVLGAEFQFEGVNLRVWEKVFLHFLPKLKRLSLMFVGPELRLPGAVPPELLATVRLCSVCESTGRALSVTFRPEKLYHEVVLSVSKPDLICLFNPGLYRMTGFEGKDTWPETIREFCQTRAPVLVTSYTEDEIPREIARIKSISELEVLLEPRRNPFASIKPDRNFVSDDTVPLIYKNYYITIVKRK